MRIVLLIVLTFVLVACADDQAKYRVVVLPNGLSTCSEAPPSPAPLPRVTTPEAQRAFAIELDRALSRAQAARNECARKLKRLNDLVGNDGN